MPNDDPDPAEIRQSVGGKIVSKRAYADRDAFAAFVRQHGRAIVEDLKKFLAKEAETGRRAGTIPSWEKAAHALAGTRCCRRCSETKPIAEMATGPAWICRPCDAARVREARDANLERARALQRRRWHARTDKQRAAHRARGRTSNARRINKAAVEAYRSKFPERARAQRLAREAERRGNIVRPAACEAVGCDETARLHRHHNSYRAPVDVVFLCHRHHEDVHHRGDVRLKPGGAHEVAHAPRD